MPPHRCQGRQRNCELWFHVRIGAEFTAGYLAYQQIEEIDCARSNGIPTIESCLPTISAEPVTRERCSGFQCWRLLTIAQLQHPDRTTAFHDSGPRTRIPLWIPWLRLDMPRTLQTPLAAWL
jgi:hypothetical protein